MLGVWVNVATVIVGSLIGMLLKKSLPKSLSEVSFSSLHVGELIGILDFSDKNVFLATHSGRINISGERLNVAIFENKTIQITGKIAEIRLV